MQSVMRTIGRGALLLAALLAPPALTANETAAPVAPEVASEPPASPALEQLMRMAGFLSRLERFAVTLDSGYDVVQESGQKIEFGETRQILLARPDRFRVEVQQSDGDSSVTVFDGQTLTVLDAQRGLYATSALAGDIDAALAHFVRDLRMRLPLALLFRTSLPEELKQRLVEAEVVETTAIDGIPCLHLAARGASVDLQLWLPTTGDPLPRRIILTYKDEEGQPQYWSNLTDWNLAPEVPAERFALAIPPEAARIPFLAQVRQAATSLAPQGEGQ